MQLRRVIPRALDLISDAPTAQAICSGLSPADYRRQAGSRQQQWRRYFVCHDQHPLITHAGSPPGWPDGAKLFGGLAPGRLSSRLPRTYRQPPHQLPRRVIISGTGPVGERNHPSASNFLLQRETGRRVNVAQGGRCQSMWFKTNAKIKAGTESRTYPRRFLHLDIHVREPKRRFW